MIPLALVDRGRKTYLRAIYAGRGLTARLASMGLVPGVELEVLSRGSTGPFVVSVKGTRLILGRGMVSKINRFIAYYLSENMRLYGESS